MILSGVLYDAGGPLASIRIVFEAQRTTLNGVVFSSEHSFTTQQDGTYLIGLEPGYYLVSWIDNGQRVRLGAVVADNSSEMSLPEALESDYTPLQPSYIQGALDQMEADLTASEAARDEAVRAASDATNVVANHEAKADPHDQYEFRVQHNTTANTAPAASDDESAGYSARSTWFDTSVTPPEAYRCIDATAGAAVWVKTSLTLDELGSAAIMDVPATGDAAAGEVVKGDDSRLSDARAPTAHNHPWNEVTEKPDTATRWPTFAETTDKPLTYPPSTHSHPLSEISDAGSAASKNTGTSSGMVPLLVQDSESNPALPAVSGLNLTKLAGELVRYSETSAAATAAIDRADGGKQTLTLTADVTLTITMANNEDMELTILNGDSWDVTWPAGDWLGGSLPTLAAKTRVVIDKDSTGTLNFSLVGDYS